MKPDEFEKRFDELKQVGQVNALFPKQMIDDDLAIIGTILNFISAELGLLIRANLEMWKALQLLIENRGE